MGKINDIKVVFGNRNRSIFKPGSTLTGHVLLKVSKMTKVTVVTATLRGSCRTKWSVGSEDKKHYKEKETYTSQEVALWGGVPNQIAVLQAGEQQKEFSFTLPTNCPSSFSSKHGNVSYSLKITCKFPGISSNQDIVRPFRVYDVVDLTSNPLTAELFYKPLHVRGRARDDCCICFHKVSSKVDLTMDKSAYAPGDKVLLNGCVENGSNKGLPIAITLCQRIKCYGKRSDFSLTSSGNLKSKEKVFEICTWRSHPVAKRSKKSYHDEPTLTIPALVASGLRHCKFISVSYFLKISATMKGFSSVNIFLQPQEIVIGHRSLPDYNSLDHSSSSLLVIPSAPVLDDDSDDDTVLPTYDSAVEEGDFIEVHRHDHSPPPPSYLEATSMDDLSRIGSQPASSDMQRP